MATISRWDDNTRIVIYPNEGHHQLPHFHILKRGEFDASIQVDPFEVLEGSLPSGLERDLKDWVEEHEGELLDNWQAVAVDGERHTTVSPP